MHSKREAFPRYEYSRADLLNAFEQGPARLAVAISGLEDHQLRERARGPSRWCIQEIVIHIVDSEISGALRIRKVVAEPGSLLPSYDQNRFAAAIDYAGEPRESVEDAIVLLQALRRHSLRVLRRTEASSWTRVAQHAEFGDVTLLNLLALYADHTERHIEQILMTRRLLGTPIRMPFLLPKRLY